MQRQKVNSSDLSSVGYDVENNVLEIQFSGGDIYQYIGVPKSVYDGLLNAGSKGRYFHMNVNKHYAYRKVG